MLGKGGKRAETSIKSVAVRILLRRGGGDFSFFGVRRWGGGIFVLYGLCV